MDFFQHGAEQKLELIETARTFLVITACWYLPKG